MLKSNPFPLWDRKTVSETIHCAQSNFLLTATDYPLCWRSKAPTMLNRTPFQFVREPLSHHVSSVTVFKPPSASFHERSPCCTTLSWALCRGLNVVCFLLAEVTFVGHCELLHLHLEGKNMLLHLNLFFWLMLLCCFYVHGFPSKSAYSDTSSTEQVIYTLPL